MSRDEPFVHARVARVVGEYLRPLRRFAFPAIAIALPLALMAQLLNQYGLFELGDANFPLRPFPLDYFLPWQERGAAGLDNVFIGVPRLVYYLGINAAIQIGRNLQVAQWLWYAGMLALGIWGATLLARRLGAGELSLPIGVFYAANLWSYDRLAQGSIFLAFEGLPLVLFLFLRCLEEGSWRSALRFALSVLLVLPSMQVTYLAAALCLAIAAYFLILKRATWSRVWPLVLCAVLASGFFAFPMLADFASRSSNALTLVNSRFSLSVFEGYAARATPLNTLRLASFFFSSFGRQPVFVQLASLLPLILFVAAANVASAWRRRAFIAAALLLVAGLWLVDGVRVALPLYAAFREWIPSLRLFVEPDYFSPLVVLAYVWALSSATPAARSSYGRVWAAGISTIAIAGTLPFLPFWGPQSGMPQTLVPAIYSDFAATRVSGRTFWQPNLWVARYVWSPYLVNGFNVQNSPSDAIGPQMLEWTPEGTLLMSNRLSDAFQAGDTKEALALMRDFDIQQIAVAADQIPPDGSTPNPAVENARRVVAKMIAAGDLRDLRERREAYAELFSAQVPQPLPLIGVYPRSVSVMGGAREASAALAAMLAAGRYRPLELVEKMNAAKNAIPVSLAPSPVALSAPSQQPCVSQTLGFRRYTALVYTLAADIRGSCALVFRDSFAPQWRLAVTSGRAGIGRHFEADGYANGWDVGGSGPVTLRVYNVLAIPYALGLVTLALCVLALIALEVRPIARQR